MRLRESSLLNIYKETLPEHFVLGTHFVIEYFLEEESLFFTISPIAAIFSHFKLTGGDVGDALVNGVVDAVANAVKRIHNTQLKFPNAD